MEATPAATSPGFAATRLKAFDQRLVEDSRTAVRGALGEEAYGELIDHGAKAAWEDLPLVHRQRGTMVSP